MIRMFRTLALALGLALAAPFVAPAAGAESPPLREVEHVNSRLLAAAIGDQIRRNCPTISERRWVVRAEALKLFNYAISLGHSRRSIEAYLDDPDARAWMEGQRDAWLAARGAEPGDAESHCRIGMQEIAQGSYLGSLLRAD